MKTVLLIALLIVLLQNSPQAYSQNVRITSMADFSFGTWGGSNDLQSSDAVCIYRQGQPNNNYTITMTGPGTGGSFVILSGANTLAFTAEFAGSDGVYQTMSAGVARTFGTTNNHGGTTCQGGTNAQIRITILETNILNAEAATFSGTLSVVVQAI